MKLPIFVFIVYFCFLSGFLKAQTATVTSPNGEIKVELDIADKIYYSVYYNSDLLLKNCRMQMDLGNEKLGDKPKLLRRKKGSIQENIKREVPFKNAVVNNHCNTLRLDFAGNYAVEFRVFDDGVAYRFLTDKKKTIDVTGEDFVIEFPENYLAHLSQTKGFKTSYERPYSHVRTQEYKADDQMSYLPVLLETNKPYKILISEADLNDYPCMFLKSTGKNGLESLFPKNPVEFGDDGDRSVKILKEAPYIARTKGKRSFPWRYFVITKEDTQIVENEMTFKLSSPCELEDASWIKPGLVTWEWWHGANLYGVDFKSGFNEDSYKYYIDFASQHGIPYIIMDEGWAKSTRDPYTPNPKIDLFKLIQYGKERNVKIILWLTWLTVENHFDLFQKFSEWGIAGLKIDFMDRSDQWMVNYYERVAREAAKHHLFVSFHGAFKPAGLERRYPNVLTYEGVLGQEQGGNARPGNSIYLPFMRNAVGPMDFTPGAMLNVQPEHNRATSVNQMGTGTRCNMMSMFVLFETGLQMLADNPMNYLREKECTDFITSVPVTWDETKALAAKVGEYVIVAKRKGDRWYIGGMSNTEPHSVEISFGFLPEGKEFTLTSFEDGINADRQAMDYKKRERKVNKNTRITVNMVRNGGFAGIIQ